MANRPASEVAREIAGLCSHNRETKFWDWCGTCRLASKIASALLAREAAAVEAERERCAQTIEDMWRSAPNDRPEYRQNTISHGCIAAIQAIRGSK